MAITLITTNTESGDATSSFTSGIDSTYKLYIFKFIDINPATDGAALTFQGNASSQTGYNETMTTTFFRAYHDEADSGTAVQIYAGDDQAQGTAFQHLVGDGTGNGSDESCAGTLWLFNPSSTTYVKHFCSTMNNYMEGDYSINEFMSGYFNVTAAITNIQFKMDSGNFDGTIKMYGVA